jgi:hypothetical protein
MVGTINGWFKAGVKDTEIERRLKQADQYISRITLGKHKRKHLITVFEQQRKAAAESLEKQARTLKAPKTSDLAQLVRDTSVALVESGDLTPSLSEGLRAQEILDRRAEKGADRDLLLQLAQVLGGAVPVIEGTYRDVTPEAREDAEEFAQLTAG